MVAEYRIVMLLETIYLVILNKDVREVNYIAHYVTTYISIDREKHTEGFKLF